MALGLREAGPIHGLQHPFQAEIGQAIGFEELFDLRDRVVGGDEFFPPRCVYSVETGAGDGGELMRIWTSVAPA